MDGARSMAGRKRRRTPAARSDADRTSSASLAEAGRSAPARRRTPSRPARPRPVSSTTVASSADSACTAITAGWMRSENRLARMFTRGRGTSAHSASSGLSTSRMTATPRASATFDMVSGIITTNICTCCRSLLARLMSWPVCVWSWKPMCRACRWAKSRSRSQVSVQPRLPEGDVAPAPRSGCRPRRPTSDDGQAQTRSDPSPSTAPLMAAPTRRGTITFVALHSSPISAAERDALPLRRQRGPEQPPTLLTARLRQWTSLSRPVHATQARLPGGAAAARWPAVPADPP